MARRLRLGIVGTGVAARLLYLPVWKSLRRKIELVACTNRTREKAEEYARLAGVPRVVDTPSALIGLEEVEAVLISLPIHLQPAIVLEALKAGKAVVSEKPIAPSVAAAKRLIKSAARYEAPWLVGENFRFMSHVARLKQWVDKGQLGEIRLLQATQITMMDEQNPYFHTAWRHQPKHVGGFVVDAGVHVADVVQHCFGRAVRVSGMARSLSELPPPDTATAIFELESGALGTWSSCFGARYEGPMLRVFGSAGSAEVFFDRAKLLDRRGRETVHVSKVNSFEAELSHFADVVKRGVRLAITPEEALADLAFVERIVRNRAV